MATFRGLRHVPMVALSHNSLYPSVLIDEGGIMIRVVRRHYIAFEAIEALDYRRRLAHQVTITPRKRPWTFSANFIDRHDARQLLAAVADRSVSLTTNAQHFLAVDM